MDPKTRNLIALATVVVLMALAFWQAWPVQDKIAQGLDIKGGLSVILTAEPLGSGPLTEESMERVETILLERVDGFGLTEATVQRQGANAFLIQLPGVSDARQALEVLGEPGRLEFVDLSSVTESATIDLAYQHIEADRAGGVVDLEPLEPGSYEPFMTGEVITSAQVTTDQFGNAAVSVTMSPAGTQTWGEVTTRLAPARGQALIVLDGYAKSAPAVQEPILTGDTQITGQFTFDEAKRLAAVLQAGALPVDLTVDESRVVGPTLGQESLQQGLLAALMGLALVVVFMVVYYRGLGVVSIGGLIVYGVLLIGSLGVLSSMGAFALTLPGIAGIILTIGVAADTSILIYERLKEEIDRGKTHRSAAKSAVRSAIATSIDADIVALVSAVALYALAIGPVRGFAFTLILGIFIDLVAAILFTGPVVRLLAEGWMTKAPWLFGVHGIGEEIAPKSRIDFMGKRRIFFAVSGALVAVSVAVLLFVGLTFGIDFRGGTSMTFVGAEGTTTEAVRSALEAAGVPDTANATIQPTDEGGFIVRTAESDTAAAQRAFAEVTSALSLPEQDANVTTIGPGWGKSVTNAAILALAVSILAILLYISIRFEYKMSVSAVVALVHDTIVVLGVYALSGREVTPNTIAALLTILGYSLYDTIVVFHRIRENATGLTRTTFMDMTNESINQVLMRWANTGLIQVMPVVALFFFGGETLRDFAFAMAVGLVVAAYSTISLASPMYAVWKEREPRFQALRRKAEAQAGK